MFNKNIKNYNVLVATYENWQGSSTIDRRPRTLRIGGKLHLRGHVQDIPREMAYCFIATNFTHGIKNTKWDPSRSTTREKVDQLIKFDRCDCITRLESNILRPRLTQVFISTL